MTQSAVVNKPPKVDPLPRRVCPLTTREVCDRLLLLTEELAGVKFYTYQALFCRRVIESVLLGDGAIITALWSRQSGKTSSVAYLGVGLAVGLPALHNAFPDDDRFKPYADGFLMGIYAPVDNQAQLAFRKMRKRMQHEKVLELLHDPEIDVDIVASNGDRLAFSNGSVVLAHTASETAQIEGETHHLVVVEEAQKMSRSKVDKEIRPMLASTDGTMVCIGTAWISKGGFHSNIRQNTELYKARGIRNHFEFTYDIVIQEKRRAYERDKNPQHLKYERFVQKEIVRTGGKDSEEFRMNFMLMWQESRIIAVDEAMFKRLALPNVEAGTHHRGFLVAALDVAKNNDDSVLTLVKVDVDNPIVDVGMLPGDEKDAKDKGLFYVKIVVDWLEMQGNFEGNDGQYQMVKDYFMSLAAPIQAFVVDATGMGDPVCERFNAMFGHVFPVIPYTFGTVSKHVGYRYSMQELKSGRILYAAGAETKQRNEFRKFVNQHTDLDRVQVGAYTVYQAPDGEHDDYPDSLMLACQAEKFSHTLGRMGVVEVDKMSAFGSNSASRFRTSPGAGEGLMGNSRQSRYR